MGTKIKLRIPRFKLSWQSFLSFIYKLEGWLIAGFILFSLSFEYLRWTDKAGVPVFLYYFAVTVLILRITIKLLSKSEFLKTIPFDIQALLLVSTVALSLFVGIVMYQTKQNVWGGASLRMLSGGSVVALWFMYYFIASRSVNITLFKKYSTLFLIAPLIALLFFVFNLNATLNNLIDIVVVLQSGYLWMFISSNKNRWIALVNILLGFVLVFFSSAGAQITAMTVALFSIIITLFKNKKSIILDFKNLKINQILKSGHSPNAVHLLVTILVLILSTIAILNNPLRTDISSYLVKGFNEVTVSNDLKGLFLGNGLQNISSSTFFTIFNSFGVFPVIVYVVLMVSVFKNLVNALKNKKVTDKHTPLFLITGLSGISIYLFLFTPADVVILAFWILIALATIYMQVCVEVKQVPITDLKLITYEDSTDESIRDFKLLLQKLTVIILLGTLFFLLYSIGGLVSLMT